MYWTKESSLAQLYEPSHVSPDRRLVNIHTETKFQYIFIPHSNILSGKKEAVVLYLMHLHIVSTSGTTDGIQGIYSGVQNVENRRGLSSISFVNVSMQKLHFLLTIVPAGNQLVSNPTSR